MQITERQKTITVTSGETIALEFPRFTQVDIFNGTTGEIYVNDTGDFDDGGYFAIPEGGAYNGYRPPTFAGAVVAIQATADGTISVITSRY